MSVIRTVLLALVVCVATGSLAHAQGVSFADLEGATIHATRTEIRNVRLQSGGGNSNQRVVMSNTIRVGAGGKLTPSLTITADGAKEGIGSATRTFGGNTVSLGQPHAARDGQQVWIFEGSTLTAMNTRAQGGHILKITFSRGSGGLSCRITGGFAREDGTGGVALSSNTHGKGTVEVVSVKQAGSSCRVSK